MMKINKWVNGKSDQLDGFVQNKINVEQEGLFNIEIDFYIKDGHTQEKEHSTLDDDDARSLLIEKTEIVIILLLKNGNK